VAYQGGIDHLLQAGRLTIRLAHPGWYGSSSWIRCTGTAPSKTPKASGILAFQHDLIWSFGFMDVGEIRRASRKVLAEEIQRVAAAAWRRAPGRPSGLADARAASPAPSDGWQSLARRFGEARYGPGAATGHGQVLATRRKIVGTRGLDLAGRPLIEAGVP
jgi:hypothetical protein